MQRGRDAQRGHVVRHDLPGGQTRRGGGRPPSDRGGSLPRIAVEISKRNGRTGDKKGAGTKTVPALLHCEL